MRVTWTQLPFKFKTMAEYEAALSKYISDVFYELLPAAGYEVREEQIYTAFRIARALAKNQVLLAEAGLGTGKTFAYLVAAVCHARLRGQPVVVSSASGILQEQLAAESGDIALLSRLLRLNVDARLAKDPTQHLCELKVERLRLRGTRRKGLTQLLRWAEGSERGDRTEVPEVPDETWELAAWDPGLPCDTCPRRAYCRLAVAREHYRKAADLVVVDHRLFFHDLWTRRERKEAGLQPVLPPYSGVVFDEGHEMVESAQLAAGHRLQEAALARTIEEATGYDDRPGLMRATRAAQAAARLFWGSVAAAVRPGETERQHLERTAELERDSLALVRALEALQDELAIEEAMFEEHEAAMNLLAFQGRLDQASAGLRLLRRPADESVVWAVEGRTTQERDLWVVPRHVGEMLQRELYSQGIPVVLSSATLASGDSFDYMKRVIGAPTAQQTQVGVPFDLGEQALIYLPTGGFRPEERLVELLHATEGRALILVNDRREQRELRAYLEARPLPWKLLWEGDLDRTELVRRFKADIHSILIGTSFWEGIDVPGAALSCVAILRLPFPAHDPVIAARRADAAAAGLDPFEAVDVPAMAIRLKQGRGRLIRTAQDRGVAALLDASFRGESYEEAVLAAFPEDSEQTGDLERVRSFLTRG